MSANCRRSSFSMSVDFFVSMPGRAIKTISHGGNFEVFKISLNAAVITRLARDRAGEFPTFLLAVIPYLIPSRPLVI